MQVAIFELLLLPPLDEAKFFGKNFCPISQDKRALLLSFQKHYIEPNWFITFSGLLLQESVHGHSQKFGFGVTLKQKVQSHGCYVSAAAKFSKCSITK